MPTTILRISGTLERPLTGDTALGRIPIIIGTGALSGQGIVRALGTGDTVTAIPAGSVGVVIVPPAGNTVTMTARTSGASGGMDLSLTLPSVYTFNTASLPANLTINASGSVSVDLIWL